MPRVVQNPGGREQLEAVRLPEAVEPMADAEGCALGGGDVIAGGTVSAVAGGWIDRLGLRTLPDRFYRARRCKEDMSAEAIISSKMVGAHRAYSGMFPFTTSSTGAVSSWNPSN